MTDTDYYEMILSNTPEAMKGIARRMFTLKFGDKALQEWSL